MIPISGLAVILGDGPRQLLVNPLTQCGDVLVRETRTPQRHLEIADLLDGTDQQAVRRHAGLRSRTAFAALKHVFTAIQRQPATPVRGVVAGVAVAL